jgi:hypothetical protein
LEFFTGHECYSGISCGYGSHTISLKKSGYASWNDTQNFLSGVNLEANPVLNRETVVTSSPTPTPTLSIRPTPRATPSVMKISTEAAELASSDSNISQSTLGLSEIASITNDDQPANNRGALILPGVLIFVGICCIAFAIFSIIKRGKKGYTGEGDKQNFKIS